MNLKIEPLPPGALKTLFSAGSDLIQLLGQVTLNLEIENLHFKYTVYVVNKLCRKILLDLDFLKHHVQSCNFQSGTVTVFNKFGRKVTIPFVKDEQF